MKKIEWLTLVLVLLLGIWLRIPEVLNRNPLFGFDQGRDYLAVKSVVVDRKPTLIGSEVGAGMAGLKYIFHGPYYYYSLIMPFILLGGDPYGGLVLMFGFGVVSLFLCFLFTKEVFGTKTALVATLLTGVALSAQSRFMWNSHPATFFIILVFWAFSRFEQNPRKYFFLACFLAGVIYGFQLAISVALIVTLFLFIFWILKNKDLKTYLAGVLGVILAYLPFFGFEARHGWMATKSMVGFFASLVRGQKTFSFWQTWKEHLLVFWFNFRDTFYIPEDWHWWLLGILIVAVTLFLINTKNRQAKNLIIFWLLLMPVTYFLFMFLESAIWGHYLIHLHLVYIMLFAYLVVHARFNPARWGLILFLIFMAPRVGQEIKKACADYFDYGGVAKMKGKLDAIDYIYQDAGGQKFNVLVFTPPVYDYAYRYLLGWYGEKKYGYVPGNQKEGLFYLWIEPERAKPWTYEGWLETVIKTGRVVKEEKLPSGFIIQKRYEED